MSWPPEGFNSGIGYGYTPEYDQWYQMLRRCFWEEHKQYCDYGGRGITVDFELRSLPVYLKLIDENLGIRLSSGHSIDRVDNNGDYTILNLRWASQSEQNANQRQRVSGNYPVGVTGYRGVSEHSVTGLFRARIGVKGRGEICLGYFDTPQDAARAYDLGAKIYHGLRAKLNFPED